jgi:hypothetical protein
MKRALIAVAVLAAGLLGHAVHAPTAPSVTTVGLTQRTVPSWTVVVTPTLFTAATASLYQVSWNIEVWGSPGDSNIGVEVFASAEGSLRRVQTQDGDLGAYGHTDLSGTETLHLAVGTTIYLGYVGPATHPALFGAAGFGTSQVQVVDLG